VNKAKEERPELGHPGPSPYFGPKPYPPSWAARLMYSTIARSSSLNFSLL
jgi:hypothetical protein